MIRANSLIAFTAAAIAAALPLQPALAWDDGGHEIIALVAEHYLSPVAREKVTALLQSDPDLLTAHDMASAASWADKYQNSDKDTTQQRYNQTRDWHYAEIAAARPNIPAACFGQPELPAGTPASQGPAKACVIDKINQFAAELADPKTSGPERILALKFLLNLVGDAHQPLNVADEDGGHGLGIRVAATSITPGELYNYWNSAFVTSLGVDREAVANRLISRITENDVRLWSSSAPQLWALEAHQLGIDKAYGMLQKVDDRGTFRFDDADLRKASDLVGIQLSRAGVRLAYILNDAFAPQASKKAEVRAGDAAAGRTLAQAMCTVCHVVAPNQANPKQFTTAPDFQAIADTHGMSQSALHGFLFGPHPTMPKMSLSEKQANNVSAYIISLRKAP